MLWRMWEIGIIGINYQNYCGFIPKENCFIFIVTTDEKRVIEMSMDPAIGARIRREREKKHYTWEDLAEYAGISSKFLYEIENGQKGLSATSLLKICKSLNVSCDYILTGENALECNQELIDIIESFDTAQIQNVKKMLLIMLEVSKL